MKTILLHGLQILFYPIVWCHQVIMDAPIPDCDNALLSYGETSRYFSPERATIPCPSVHHKFFPIHRLAH